MKRITNHIIANNTITNIKQKFKFQGQKSSRFLLKNNGITLIALVITIIVLLILAGVSIAMLTGQNGILTQAQNAKLSSKISEIKENAKTDILSIQTGTQNTKISKFTLKNTLDKYFDNVPIELTPETELTLTSEYGKLAIKLSDIYQGELTSEALTARDISNIPYKKNLYGATVTGYILPSTTQTDVGWKILYADNDNIYLIADNYIEQENLPNSTLAGTLETQTTRKPNWSTSNYPRAAFFNNILEDYEGSFRISDKLKRLNNDYFNFKNYDSTNINMRAVAYMMDTATWNNVFKDINGKAEYVIGGPTIEMLFNSYNEKYETSFMAEALTPIGYNIKKGNDDDWNSDTRCMLTQNNTIQDSLYMLSNSNAFAYWLSSPAADYTTNLIYISNYGDVVPGNYGGSSIGFRPVICLNSDTQLQQISDTEYLIK